MRPRHNQNQVSSLQRLDEITKKVGLVTVSPRGIVAKVQVKRNYHLQVMERKHRTFRQNRNLIKRKINSIVYLSKEQLIKNSEVEINLQLSFKERLMIDEDKGIVNMLNTTQFELKNRFNGSEDYFTETKNEIKVILEKDYARNYLNLKFRHRYFVQLFLNNFSNEVSELKTLILKDL